MVVQYPYSFKAITANQTVKGEKGRFEPGGKEVLLTGVCRAEPAKANQYIVGKDGLKIHFSSIVYMPIPGEDVTPGMLFEVWDGENLKVSGSVLQYSKGQLNARVWL